MPTAFEHLLDDLAVGFISQYADGTEHHELPPRLRDLASSAALFLHGFIHKWQDCGVTYDETGEEDALRVEIRAELPDIASSVFRSAKSVIAMIDASTVEPSDPNVVLANSALTASALTYALYISENLNRLSISRLQIANDTYVKEIADLKKKVEDLENHGHEIEALKAAVRDLEDR